MKQSTIDKAIDGIKVLSLLINFEGMLWTGDMLKEILCFKDSQLYPAITWLTSNGHIVYYQHEYIPTDNGRQFFDAAKRQSSVVKPGETYAFKYEALSGIIEKFSSKSGFTVSKQSEITNAALPRGKPERSRDKTPEEILLEKEHVNIQSSKDERD